MQRPNYIRFYSFILLFPQIRIYSFSTPQFCATKVQFRTPQTKQKEIHICKNLFSDSMMLFCAHWFSLQTLRFLDLFVWEISCKDFAMIDKTYLDLHLDWKSIVAQPVPFPSMNH